MPGVPPYYVAFGYENTNPITTTIGVGAFNFFDPPPIDRGQVITFSPGVQNFQFTIEFSGAPITWTVNGVTTTASIDLIGACTILPTPVP